MHFRSLDELVRDADGRLADTEGFGLEKLAGALYEERSRKGLDGFRLTARIRGYWDRGDTELDLVALNEEDRIVRLGSCKRAAERLAPDYARFDAHAARFLDRHAPVAGWRLEKVAITTRHTSDSRRAAERAGYVPQDIQELTHGL